MATGTEIVILAGTVSSGFFIFSLTRGLKMREEGRPLAELLWYVCGLIPLAGVCLFWVSIGNQPVLSQRIVLFVIGAVIGGCGLLAAGELLRPATAQSGNTAMTARDNLVAALNDLASAIAAAPPVVIGSRTIVTAGPGSSGTVIGKQVTVTAGPGAQGTIIGEQTTVTAGGPNSTPPINNSIAAALREGARRVGTGGATRAEISALIAQSILPGANSELNAARNRADAALQASELP
jgi:hypothetical protein